MSFSKNIPNATNIKICQKSVLTFHFRSMKGIAPYTLFLVILMVTLFIFSLWILSQWLNIQIPFISNFTCANLKAEFCEKWRATGVKPTMDFPKGCEKPTWDECFK